MSSEITDELEFLASKIEGKRLACPHCAGELPLELIAKVHDEHRVLLRLHPKEDGSRLHAKTVGGMIRNFDNCMRAIGRDIGIKTTVVIEDIKSEEDGAISMTFLILNSDSSVKKRGAK